MVSERRKSGFCRSSCFTMTGRTHHCHTTYGYINVHSPYCIPTPKGSISSELPDSSNFGASPTTLDDEDPTGASRPGACDAVDAAGLSNAGGSATVGSAGKLWWEAEASLPGGSTTPGRGDNAAAIPSTAKASPSSGSRAPGRTCVRAVFHGLSTSTEGIPPLPPASRGEAEAEGGKEEGVIVAQGFTAVLTEPENVLALTACVMRGGSNRDSVVGVEVASTDGEALRRDGALQS
jgi:hypothetical protein